MPNPNPSPETRFKPGKPTNLKAGGVAQAIKDLSQGKPLRGDLAELQYRFEQDIATHEGRLETEKHLVATLLAIVEGLRCVVQDALERNEPARAAAYAVNLGTLASKAGSELRAYAAMIDEKDKALVDYDTLLEELRQ